jgi:hypothetical protein
MNAGMKKIEKVGSLKLHKETLRSLSPVELTAVNGASAGGGFCISDFCGTTTTTIGQNSMPNLGCGQTILTTGVFDPLGNLHPRP